MQPALKRERRNSRTNSFRDTPSRAPRAYGEAPATAGFSCARDGERRSAPDRLLVTVHADVHVLVCWSRLEKYSTVPASAGARVHPVRALRPRHRAALPQSLRAVRARTSAASQSSLAATAVPPAPCPGEGDRAARRIYSMVACSGAGGGRRVGPSVVRRTRNA